MLFGYDVVFGMMKAMYIMAWFIGAGIVSAGLFFFFLHFKPTAKHVRNFFYLNE
jgi:hypothetical protein